MHETTNKTTPVGIVAYGTYIPELRLATRAIVESRGNAESYDDTTKSVPNWDEDTTTLSVAAAAQALKRMCVKKSAIGALFIGSESHPYAVKPTGTMVAGALGLSSEIALADFQFACKAGTQALQAGYAYVKAGLTECALALGSDTAQAKPGDALEFTAGAGSAAFVVGTTHILAEILATASVATDTPDFWRHATENYPRHAGRFTGEPAYFAHCAASIERLCKKIDISVSEVDYCVFHTPNLVFPLTLAKRFGFSRKQIEPSLVVQHIGNTYAAASLIALSTVLDTIAANKYILLVSYGSGAGSDAFLLRTTKQLVARRSKWQELVSEQLTVQKMISYEQYRQRIEHAH